MALSYVAPPLMAWTSKTCIAQIEEFVNLTTALTIGYDGENESRKYDTSLEKFTRLKIGRAHV